jgi:hypothetical protein
VARGPGRERIRDGDRAVLIELDQIGRTQGPERRLAVDAQLGNPSAKIVLRRSLPRSESRQDSLVKLSM